MKYEWNQYSSTLNIEIQHSKLHQLLVFIVNSNQSMVHVKRYPR